MPRGTRRHTPRVELTIKRGDKARRRPGAAPRAIEESMHCEGTRCPRARPRGGCATKYLRSRNPGGGPLHQNLVRFESSPPLPSATTEMPRTFFVGGNYKAVRWLRVLFLGGAKP